LFLLVILMLSLLRRSLVARAFGYCIAFLAGAIKYYPFILLGLMVRERLRVLIPIALTSLIALVLFFQIYAAEILEGLPHIASGSPFGDTFGAKNFPIGMFLVFQQLMGSSDNASRTALLATIALIAAIVWTMSKFWRASDIPAALNRLDEPRSLALLAGCCLISGCFFAGQNIGYRGIFLLLVLPGFFALGHDKATGSAASAARLAAISIVPLMWAEAIRHWIRIATTNHLTPISVAPGLGQIEFWAWCAREVIWWFLVAVLLSILLGFIVECPVFRVCRRNILARGKA
jgi:predicted membrane protein